LWLLFPALWTALKMDKQIFWRIFPNGIRDRCRTSGWIYDLPGGVFHEVAAHPVYLQMEFLKTLKVVSAISKKTGSDLPIPSDDLHVLFDGQLGVGSFSSSIYVNPHLVFLNIFGTEMTIHVDLTTNTLVKFRRSGGGSVLRAMVNIDHGLQLLSKTVGSKVQALLGQRKPGHRILIEKFYESLREGTKPPVTGEDGRAVVDVLDQIWVKLGWQ